MYSEYTKHFTHRIQYNYVYSVLCIVHNLYIAH